MSLADYKNVIVTCPTCLQSEVVESLEVLDSVIHEQWQLSIKFAREEEKEELRKAMVLAGMMNHKDRIINALQQNGFLKICYRTCITDMTEKQYVAQGYKFVRRGNFLFLDSYYNKNKDFIESEIKEHQLDKVTFFT